MADESESKSESTNINPTVSPTPTPAPTPSNYRGPAPAIKGPRVFISGSGINESIIKEHFGPHCTIAHILVKGGFAFIEVLNDTEVDLLVEKFNGIELDGIKYKFARARDRPTYIEKSTGTGSGRYSRDDRRPAYNDRDRDRGRFDRERDRDRDRDYNGRDRDRDRDGDRDRDRGRDRGRDRDYYRSQDDYRDRSYPPPAHHYPYYPPPPSAHPAHYPPPMYSYPPYDPHYPPATAAAAYSMYPPAHHYPNYSNPTTATGSVSPRINPTSDRNQSISPRPVSSSARNRSRSRSRSRSPARS